MRHIRADLDGEDDYRRYVAALPPGALVVQMHGGQIALVLRESVDMAQHIIEVSHQAFSLVGLGNREVLVIALLLQLMPQGRVYGTLIDYCDGGSEFLQAMARQREMAQYLVTDGEMQARVTIPLGEIHEQLGALVALLRGWPCWSREQWQRAVANIEREWASPDDIWAKLVEGGGTHGHDA